MRPRTVLLLAQTALASAASAQVPIHRGEVVSSSRSWRPGTYLLPAPVSMDSGVMIVRGHDIVVDLRGVTLVGTPPGSSPDLARGVAILVDGGTNITIIHARIRGYKVAILARGTRGLRIIDCDLSRNWKPRLYSIVEHESLADWLSFHHNENDEWLRYGAAIYLRDVNGGEIRGTTVVQGMNALLAVRTDSLLVADNDFSFNSGLGIGLYRSSHNRIMHNRVEYDVRGYSEGFYRRGQDSAGILLYEQSDSNVVAFNSVTHGGDGLFVWAGQHTMDTGAGGVNDNVFYENDFSWAPANGMEATFSRNVFIGNRVVGNDYGLWGGYSYGSLVLGNEFAFNRVGVAIEHGQDNRILQNSFLSDSTAVQLWANPIEPGDWGYPKHRDTRSRDYEIRWNAIHRARVALRVSGTNGLDARSNGITADTALVAKDTERVLLDSSDVAIAVETGLPAPRVPASIIALRRRYGVQPLHPVASILPGPFANWPRSTIIVDEWGPYDWKSPKLWPADSSLSTPLRLRVVGPTSMPEWIVRCVRGAAVSARRGKIGDPIVVAPDTGGVEDWTLTLAAGRDTFSYSRFDAKPRWQVSVFSWTDSTHPVNATNAFAALLRGERGAATATFATGRMDYVWYRPKVVGWPAERAAVVATASVDLPTGRYRLHTISDDGIRVLVDDRLVIDDWTIHESTAHDVDLPAGHHAIRVEYFQLDGWTELQVLVEKQKGAR